MPVVLLDEVERLSTKALVRHGATEAVAAPVGRAIRTAEANADRVWGLESLPTYCQQLGSGRIDGTAEPVVSVERAGAVRVDGRLGFAQAAFAAGLPQAVVAARNNGICGFSVEHTHNCGALGYFTEQLAGQGLLAIGSANTGARVAPVGGSAPVLGANPIAMAAPDGSGGVAFQFDFSTSVTSPLKIERAMAAGQPIPPGWALDRDGNPTADPEAALDGILLPAAGHKGFAIGLLVELLAAGLTGSRRSTDIPPLKATFGPPHDVGQFYIVIDPTAYSGRGFYDQLRTLAASIAGQSGARLPGAGRTEHETVDIDRAVWLSVRELAS